MSGEYFKDILNTITHVHHPMPKPSYPIFHQADTRWGATPISQNGARTLASDGCLITCVTMKLHNYAAKYHMTPQEFVAKLKTGGALDAGGNFDWMAFARIYPELYFAKRVDTTLITDRNLWFKETPEKAWKTIDKLLTLGQAVPVWVDTLSDNNDDPEHWVLVVDKEGDDYIIHDPGFGEKALLSKRYGKGRIFGYASIIGEVLETDDNATELERAVMSALRPLYTAQNMLNGHAALPFVKDALQKMID